jgi:hypothetical protein
MDTSTRPLTVETEAVRKAYAAFTGIMFRRLLRRATLKSSGPSLPSFREAELITGTKESRRNCRSRALDGPKDAANPSGTKKRAVHRGADCRSVAAFA